MTAATRMAAATRGQRRAAVEYRRHAPPGVSPCPGPLLACSDSGPGRDGRWVEAGPGGPSGGRLPRLRWRGGRSRTCAGAGVAGGMPLRWAGATECLGLGPAGHSGSGSAATRTRGRPRRDLSPACPSQRAESHQPTRTDSDRCRTRIDSNRSGVGLTRMDLDRIRIWIDSDSSGLGSTQIELHPESDRLGSLPDSDRPRSVPDSDASRLAPVDPTSGASRDALWKLRVSLRYGSF
jgi:hypothetical protein